MINKKTVFVLGAGASCPYGYPSGARLRELICLNTGFMRYYNEYLINNKIHDTEIIIKDIQRFTDTFEKSHIKSIDVFIANNPKLAPTGKHMIAFEVLRAEKQSCFGEKAKWAQEERVMRSDSRSRREYVLGTADFQGGDWYSHLHNRLTEGLVGKDALPDFSNGNLSFITFNYDRSLEQFFYESLCNSFTEVPEDRIIQTLKQLKILHVYGQITPFKWQNPNNYVDYKPQIDESLLQRAANSIRTIYEEKQNPELIEAHNLLKQAEQIFFLGFGYAQENLEVMGLPKLIPPRCDVYGTALNMINEEVERIKTAMHLGRKAGSGGDYTGGTKIEPLDCLMLLRKYLN